MYAPEICQANIERAAESLGFTPEYHSIDQVEIANDHFTQLLDPGTKRLTRDLNGDERRWIENERLICQFDFSYWASHYAYIRNWESALVRFRPNVAQQMFLEIIAEQERQLLAIANQILKARQLGMSTINELIVEHRAQFHPQTVAVVASCDPEKSVKMADMIERSFDLQPWFLKPAVTSRITGELLEFGNMDSRIYIQHGSQKTGIARGSTPNVGHLSECSEYDRPEELIDASLVRAMHESVRMFLSLEGTANARYDWWHKTWLFNKENYYQRRAKLQPTFLPWFIGVDLYPTATWLRARPLPNNWIPQPITVAHANTAKNYVACNPILRKYLGEGWEMPRNQMWFWEVSRSEYVSKGNLNKFMQELCGSDTGAFQSANRGVLDTILITSYRENVKPPIGVYAIDGPTALIPERFKLPKRDFDLDANRPGKQIIQIDENFRLVPLKFHGYSVTDPTGKLFIWSPPEDEFEFAAGVDTGQGQDQDRSTIEIIRKGTLDRNDEQCAEFASQHIRSLELAPFVLAVLKLYSGRLNGQYRQAKAVIEHGGAGGGENCYFELRKWGWSHFHTWVRYDKKRLRHDKASTVGWHTNAWSRPILMDYILQLIRDELITLNSPWAIDELSDLEFDAMRLKIAAAKGTHDDRFMGIAIATCSLHILETRGGALNIGAQRRAMAETTEEYPRWSPGFQGMDLPGRAPLWAQQLVEEIYDNDVY